MFHTFSYSGNPRFIDELKNLDIDNIPNKTLDALSKQLKDPDLIPERVAAVSRAAQSFSSWAHALESYGRISKKIAPKRYRLNRAVEALKEKRAWLAEV